MHTFYFTVYWIIVVCTIPFLWKTFDWFNMSLLDHATTTGFQYLMKKLGFAVLLPLFIGFYGSLFLQMIYDSGSLPFTGSSNETEQSVSSNQSLAPVNRDLTIPPMKPNISNEPAINNVSNDNKTEEYTGNDPIVRLRLGLPPKD